jgi:hypothetical protein
MPTLAIFQKHAKSGSVKTKYISDHLTVLVHVLKKKTQHLLGYMFFLFELNQGLVASPPPKKKI